MITVYKDGIYKVVMEERLSEYVQKGFKKVKLKATGKNKATKKNNVETVDEQEEFKEIAEDAEDEQQKEE